MSERIARYLERRAALERWPLECTSTVDVDQAVVIPAYAEADYLDATLDSLEANDDERLRHTLVIVVVNNPLLDEAEPDAVEENQAALTSLRTRANEGALRLGVIDASTGERALPSGEGVGLARKIGLDHGAAILAANNEPGGSLCCLDADSPVAPPYLEAVHEHMQRTGWGAAVGFEHPLPESADAASAILDYELYLRYHAIALQRTGSPHGMYAIGSTIGCTAEVYAAVSGMNRRRAGEDFYFLQELIKTGTVYPLVETLVYPSARVSRRTPFGTGKAMETALESGEPREAYNPEAYRVLGQWLSLADAGYGKTGAAVLGEAEAIHPALKPFLEGVRFERNWNRLQTNARDAAAFRAQFHRWFDGLKTLRLIHALRDAGLASMPAADAVRALLAEEQAPTEDGGDIEAKQRLNRALMGWWRGHARPCGVAVE